MAAYLLIALVILGGVVAWRMAMRRRRLKRRQANSRIDLGSKADLKKRQGKR